MNESKDAFKNVLDEVFDMQVPVLTVHSFRELRNNFYGEVLTNHIVVPSPDGKCVDMTFEVYDTKRTYLVTITSLDICFKDAIIHYTNKVLSNCGASLELFSL